MLRNLPTLTLFTAAGVDVQLRWTAAAALVAYIVAGAWVGLGGLSFTLAFCWLLLLITHEAGHATLAGRYRCRPSHIEIGVFGGVCFYDAQSATRWDQARIAWGGVLAQAALAAPFLLLWLLFGADGSETSARVLALLGPWNLAVAAFNLLPIRPLDGATAWRIVPMAFARRRPKSRGVARR